MQEVHYYLSIQEDYPVFYLFKEPDWGSEVKISSDLAERYERVSLEYLKIQQELRKLSDFED